MNESGLFWPTLVGNFDSVDAGVRFWQRLLPTLHGENNDQISSIAHGRGSMERV